MSQLYHTMYGNKVNTYAGTYIGLASHDISKIIFYLCKKDGHKAYQCLDKHNEKNKHSDKSENSSNRGSGRGRIKFNGILSCCGKEVNRNDYCWYNPHSSSKIPSWYKKYGRSSKETGLASTGNVEVLLC